VTGRNNEILIEALDNVDIEAVIDGETARPLKLKAEQVQTIKAKRRVTLRLSNGGAVNIVVNGIDRGVPGDLGKPLKVDLP
jgi:cytoskeleton protein RodZ